MHCNYLCNSSIMFTKIKIKLNVVRNITNNIFWKICKNTFVYNT